MKYLVFVVLLCSWPVFAQDVSKKATEVEIDGNFKVAAIETREQYSIVRFAPENIKEPAVVMDVDFVFSWMKVGSTVGLSGQAVMDEKSKDLKASHLLVSIKTSKGETHFWLSARSSKELDFRGAKYLKMHSPQTDYLTF